MNKNWQMAMKRIIKETLKHNLSSRLPPVVVSSMGRSGSTLIYKSLCNGMSHKRFGTTRFKTESLIRDEAWRLEDSPLKNGQVYKTHDFPHALIPSDRLRVVFLFGSASDAARSVLRCETSYGPDWTTEHFVHLAATGDIDEVPNRDVLRFEEQLDSWLSIQSVPVVGLRYEDLWNAGTEEVLSHFVGFRVSLPKRKQRESAGMNFGDLESQLASTYAALDKKISALPSVLLNEKARLLVEPFLIS